MIAKRAAFVALLLVHAAAASAQEEACYWIPGVGGIYYTEHVTTGLLDQIRIADGTRFVTTQAAIDDLGTTAGIVIIPPGYSASGPWASVVNLPPRAAVLDISGLGGPRTGNAPLVLRMVFDDGMDPAQRTVGMMIRPQYGHMTDPALFYTPYNFAQGEDAAPVPLGTKGQIDGYEANITTAQAVTDQHPGEAGHAFGATIETRGGAMLDFMDAVLTIRDTEANTYGLNLNVLKQADGGTQHLVHLQSYGYPVTSGLSLDHLNAVDGIRAGDHTIVGVSRLGVGTETPGAAVHVAAGDVAITAGGVILRSDTGACYRLTVTGAGGLTTTPAACP